MLNFKIKSYSKKADIMSKGISMFGVLIIFLMFALAAYLDSYLHGHIDKNLFTVSQSLAFGNKPAMGVMLTLGFALLIYLNMYRGLDFLYARIFLLLICYALIFTIFWVTTYYSEKDHYSIATVIFCSAITYIFLNSIALYNNRGYNTFGLVLIYLLPILAVIGFVGLSVGMVPKIREKVSQIFPSFENFILLLMGTSNLLLGFA
jgi:hypothetical protein